jgi:hypothetical protein
MKRIFHDHAVVLAIMSALMLAVGGCGGEKKMEPVPVPEMQEYKDPGIGFSFKRPVRWIENATVGRVRVYNAQDVDKKFLDPTGVGPLGVEISVDAAKNPDPAARVQEIKNELSTAGIQVGQEQPVTVDGKSGTRIPFTANWGGGNIIYGHRVFVAVDTMLYDLSYSGFGDYYNAYAAVFDASLSSFKFPLPTEKGRDETLPSETFSSYDGDLLVFSYPENFNFVTLPKGKNELVLELRGYRQDCSIRFDVFSAQGLGLDKVFEQNKGRYKARSTGSSTIGGQPAQYVAYSPAAQVDSRAYFTVMHDRVFRITMNWYKPQEAEYRAAYDKVLASIKLR